MNPGLDHLHPYPFEKLAALKAGAEPPAALSHIALSIGEPKHATPHLVTEAVIEHMHQLAVYPATRGMPELREAISAWLTTRFSLPQGSLSADKHVLPVNGTREALFAFTQVMIDASELSLVLMPNPFYQIYEGAALLAGAEPVYLNCDGNSLTPDFDQVSAETWDQCSILFLCSPGNPTGAVIGKPILQKLIKLAQQHDFIIASDECYSEIYFDESAPPAGLLEAAAEMGNDDYKHCVVFHSLSKRSNAPGLRSGFVAGDSDIIEQFFRYRTYHGCAMPMHHQAASIKAWQDEEHVRQNRALYCEKFDAVLDILDGVLEVERPDAGFYLWAKTPVEDTEFARKLFAEQNITVLPGQFLSRDTVDGNPGSNRVRMALVAPLEDCIEAAQRIKTCVESL
ncbi:succinyldiaminopimelate transaminase [Solemya velum gill symbiont]|uniref:Succinyldiaminopimelate transaminase n=4 Tax=Solemya velum gill symbiont TaxID=2340 RepID=A0A0B0H666_SOVGS|nr:succinyldiaminopimelate transaminase [Solemya velum gill symbiont]KHF25703.1 succinyldiaminopimelate transaminase [Solemya velum gill symbiont]OOY35697.1 succinyldiaminopimelate transaminase [Solemya velum gill symbiont]OOY38325.1 succinyldiaminopimelate transaminase [Solemya velum gill symbiont]OOY40758.1 succinyldiaminopimelate transaminase [Solemya velum gill symbiont]OOY48474.1 succinyldiaminopimelate transaminase [Solemya velum gill symbiont]